nr:MAG TPA: hypothetical protein [Caudoviricetes sp.]
MCRNRTYLSIHGMENAPLLQGALVRNSVIIIFPFRV